MSKLHEAKHHVNVRLDMDELDVTSAESKATYEEIKSYVAEHNDGMKVSNLYIAQVKAKYGIIERENYNKPKSDDARQPKCPKEKENAIVEALKYFNSKEFDTEMEKVKIIMEDKGFVLESDHPYAYEMQYSDAYDDVVEWLEQHGYNGKLDNVGLFEGVAVYALYDESRISYSEIKRRSKTTM